MRDYLAANESASACQLRRFRGLTFGTRFMRCNITRKDVK